MRIIGGIASGRLLRSPKGYDVRPTPDLVRQAVFNSLGARVEGARVLDLFSGSGALGLECLSRGALTVLSVDKVQRNALLIRRNCGDLELPCERLRVRVQDVFVALHQLMEAGDTFDLILADPPFGPKNVGRRSESCSQRLLDLEAFPNLLTEDGLFVLGHATRDQVTPTPWWTERKVMKHGDSSMRFLLRNMSVER